LDANDFLVMIHEPLVTEAMFKTDACSLAVLAILDNNGKARRRSANANAAENYCASQMNSRYR
jgi:hypothetical protein